MRHEGAHAPVKVKFDVEAARREFPILEERIHERPLVYLDNANTTQKPKAVLESLASEHGARMIAMHNATENARDIVRTLTLSYNKARQAGITSEILEISGGAEALRQAG